jgi:hypothetical protein
VPGRFRPEEEWARRVVQLELSRTVELNDDGSADGLYDLRVGPRSQPDIAIECVRAIDRVFTESWNAGPGKGRHELGVRGDWLIVSRVDIRQKTLLSQLPPILEQLFAWSALDVSTRFGRGQVSDAYLNYLRSMGIVSAHCYNPEGTGGVHLTFPGCAMWVDKHGESVAGWLRDFLLAQEQRDVLVKLERSEALEKHVVVIPTLSGATDVVTSYLTDGMIHLPGSSVELPEPITAVWLTPTHAPRGLLWKGGSWRFIAYPGPGALRGSVRMPRQPHRPVV